MEELFKYERITPYKQKIIDEKWLISSLKNNNISYDRNYDKIQLLQL
jgi:hypothetical protein